MRRPTVSTDGRSLFARFLALWLLAAAIGGSLFLLPNPYSPVAPASANEGCPETDLTFGTQYFNGDCSVSLTTEWANGVMTLNGDMSITADLTLTNMTIQMDSATNEEDTIFQSSGTFTMFEGGITSNTTEETLVTLNGGAVSIRNGTHSLANWDISNGDSTILFENNTDGATDARDSTAGGSVGQHFWLSANATVRYNTFQGIQVHDGAVLVSRLNWGNSLFFGNTVGFSCETPVSLTNCMGFEVISSQDQTGPVAPYPAVEIAWNNFTLDSIAASTDSNMIDIEFSDRVYVHNNTGTVDEANNADVVTEFLLSGGATESVFENNTGFGISEAGDAWQWCFYQFIYANSDNLWQYNSCDDVDEVAIISGSGMATFRHNTMTNVTDVGWRICWQCGGGSPDAGDDLIFFNNTIDYDSASAEMMWLEILVEDNNTYIANGNNEIAQWGESGPGPFHTVQGERHWLFHAEDSIESLTWANQSEGHRRLDMSANGGLNIWDVWEDYGGSDTATVSVAGAIDNVGSRNLFDDGEGTYLWQLGRDNATLEVSAETTGATLMTFTVSGMYLSEDYDVSIWNYSDSTYENQSFTTDGFGGGSFTKNFVSGGRYNISIDSVGAPPAESWSNTAPVITDPLTTDEAGHNLSYSEGFTATDVDTNQTLLWTLASNGSFLSIVSSNLTSTVSGTPAFADRDATFYVNVTVDDQGCSGACALTDFTNYTLYVNNTTPYVTNGLAADTGFVDAAYAQDFDPQDNNTDTPTWSLASDAIFLSIEVASGWVNGTLVEGAFYVNVTVVDYSGSGGSNNYTLTVAPRGGTGSARIHITLFATDIQGWDTVSFNAVANLETSGGETVNETLTYRWDFGDESPIEEGPDVTHTYAIGLWARYVVSVRICTLNDVVCEDRRTDLLLIHWPIWGAIAVGVLILTAYIGHRSVRTRVLGRSR